MLAVESLLTDIGCDTDPKARMSNESASLSADRPLSDPAQDQFGHAPFARTLAKAIRGYRGNDGIVLALYGPWGSGKSTVLAYVQHELEHGPQDGQPVVVQFNPWWFSGQENLAKAFLGQLQAVLPSKFAGFKALGDKLGEYSGALGRAVDLAGAAFGIPGGAVAVETLAKLAPTPPKDVPALKEALSTLLLKQKKRILVVIDDIDRLTPDEMRQLFTVVKALADFPYVTYLLAFDREVAAEAIAKQTGLSGDRFLEKIVQVPFDMPFVERTTLHEALFERLGEIIVDGKSDGGFDRNRWADVFFGGLNKLFRVPRDIVRLTNALSVTYPAVVGEVNPVDFIAIECLRVFLPPVYHAIRDAPEQFVGRTVPDDFPGKATAQIFHDGWLEKVPDGLRDSTRELVHRLFPRVEAVYSNSSMAAELSLTWRRDLRVCSSDVFTPYFRLSLPGGAISRADMDALLALADDEVAFGKALLDSAGRAGPGEGSRAVALLGRMMDHIPTELDAVHAAPVIRALMEVGDGLLETIRGSSGIAFGNESRIRHIAYHLFKKVSPAERLPLLIGAIERGRALRCSQYLIAGLSDEAEKAEKGEGKALLGVQDLAQVQQVWLNRIAVLSTEAAFEDHPRLALLLRGWRYWGDGPAAEAQARAWWQATSAKDEGLLKLLAAFSTHTTSQWGGERTVSVFLRVNPKLIQPFADPQTLAVRVQGLLDAGRVSEDHQPSAKRFVLECARMREGKDPDAHDFDDDDDDDDE